MNKPFTVSYEEFKLNLASLINNSGLTAAVMEPVLQNYLMEISSVAKNQYRIEKAQYEQSLLENNNVDNEKKE